MLANNGLLDRYPGPLKAWISREKDLITDLDERRREKRDEVKTIFAKELTELRGALENWLIDRVLGYFP